MSWLQAGTPHLTVKTQYDAAAKTYTVNTKQMTPPSPGQANKLPVLIPLSVGLLGPDGKDMPLTLQVSLPRQKARLVRCCIAALLVFTVYCVHANCAWCRMHCPFFGCRCMKEASPLILLYSRKQ